VLWFLNNSMMDPQLIIRCELSTSILPELGVNSIVNLLNQVLVGVYDIESSLNTSIFEQALKVVNRLLEVLNLMSRQEETSPHLGQ